MGARASADIRPETVVEDTEPLVSDQAVAQGPVQVAGSRLASTRASRAWLKVLPALAVLAVILVFVFQNAQNAKVSFVTASGKLPLGLALLGSAALGALFVLALGSIRMVQLRRAVRRARRYGVSPPEGGS
ncbi:MAG TPA: lipopolysaccharide assembly protein LapA domain-containing protein [Acidimicrobiales bacterium]|nr:lipopolysaccharide assembly protein LapA domain-containing protein [Acidimicrobiales bacterium]